MHIRLFLLICLIGSNGVARDFTHSYSLLEVYHQHLIKGDSQQARKQLSQISRLITPSSLLKSQVETYLDRLGSLFSPQKVSKFLNGTAKAYICKNIGLAHLELNHSNGTRSFITLMNSDSQLLNDPLLPYTLKKSVFGNYYPKTQEELKSTIWAKNINGYILVREGKLSRSASWIAKPNTSRFKRQNSIATEDYGLYKQGPIFFTFQSILWASADVYRSLKLTPGFEDELSIAIDSIHPTAEFILAIKRKVLDFQATVEVPRHIKPRSFNNCYTVLSKITATQSD